MGLLFDFYVNKFVYIAALVVMASSIYVLFSCAGIVICILCKNSYYEYRYGWGLKLFLAIWITLGLVFGTMVFRACMFEQGYAAKIKQHWNTTLEQYQAEQEAEKRVREAVRINEVTELRRYILVKMNPPKHFYVTLKDEQTGQVFERLYVSKHCNNFRNNQEGESYNLQVTSFSMSNQPEVRHTSFHDLYAAFCS